MPGFLGVIPFQSLDVAIFVVLQLNTIKLQREYLFDSNFTRKLSSSFIVKFCNKSDEIVSQYILKEQFQNSFVYTLPFAVEMAFQLQTTYDLSQWNTKNFF